jgi:dihydrolipoamide dehydrogenase
LWLLESSAYPRNIILATGSSPIFPDIEGVTHEMGMNQFLDMAKLPKTALVWGAGPSEVEAASILAVFGTDVTLATDFPRILPQEDREVSQRLAQAMNERDVKIRVRCNLKSIRKGKGTYHVVLSGKNEDDLKVEQVVIGTRSPNTENLGLENIGLALNENGSIQVDEMLQTSIAGIYAVGDVTGGWMLSHAASSMAVTAAENAMGGTGKYPFHLIPRGLWTIPQVGSVGLSEEEAEKKGYNVEVGDFPYAINGLAMAENRVRGSVKVVTDSEYGDILGVHIVGENATELIGEAVLAIQLECTAEELARSIRLHPTYSEALIDASRDVDSWALYLPRG